MFDRIKNWLKEKQEQDKIKHEAKQEAMAELKDSYKEHYKKQELDKMMGVKTESNTKGGKLLKSLGESLAQAGENAGKNMDKFLGSNSMGGNFGMDMNNPFSENKIEKMIGMPQKSTNNTQKNAIPKSYNTLKEAIYFCKKNERTMQDKKTGQYYNIKV